MFVFWFSLPRPLFNDPLSTTIETRDGHLLGAKIASDGQWRFPLVDSVPSKFSQCLIHFEDAYFRWHLGVNPVSLFRAIFQNVASGKVKSGGSTITMQVIRLSRKGKSRTYLEKLMELFLSIRLELSYSKDEILALYATHAPFGGNVVGVNTASWRYYQRSANQLSWGEAATLAVLPNAPSLIYPGKNQELLKSKRNRLLDKLVAENIIDSSTAELAKLEALPGNPKPLPNNASHLLERTIREGGQGKRNVVTLDRFLQNSITDLVNRYHLLQSQNEIHNAAVLVLDLKKNEVLSYVGNTNCNHPRSGKNVDIIVSPRSTGSILKPLLYAGALDNGLLLPNSLLPDVPVLISGYRPKNFNKKYDGAVEASDALIRSLNVPHVKLLQNYGLPKFHHLLQQLNLKNIDKHANHYGLTLILGGAESNLWDLTNVYGGMAGVLNNFFNNSSQYNTNEFAPATYVLNNKNKENSSLKKQGILSAGAIWKTLDVLTDVARPTEEGDWQQFASSRKVAWKTGTSFGHRDAWAIGVTPEYVVGVWVGNADGEGRPGLTGVTAAAPLMFDVFGKLPASSWFDPPYDELTEIATCAQSGFRMGPFCDDTDTVLAPLSGLRVESCSYHSVVQLNEEQSHRVNSKCYPVDKMVERNWFSLSPAMEWYYKQNNPSYQVIPPLLVDCINENESFVELIYPKLNAKLFIPKDLSGNYQQVVFEAATTNGDNESLFWHLDDTFLGETNVIHKVDIKTTPGWHKLTIVDQNGNMYERSFEFVGH